jgi:hypothetical protein
MPKIEFSGCFFRQAQGISTFPPPQVSTLLSLPTSQLSCSKSTTIPLLTPVVHFTFPLSIRVLSSTFSSSVSMQIPFPKLTIDSSSSMISPLTLPRGVAGYFDHVASKGAAPTQLHPPAHPSLDDGAAHQPRGSRVYSPLSPGARSPALHPTSFRSPAFHGFAGSPSPLTWTSTSSTTIPV